jgi:hypothetical protein
MGNRGRRLCWGRTARLALAGLLATAVLLPASVAQAAPGDNPGPLRPLTSATELGKLRLTEHRVPTSSLDNLANLMGTSRGVSQVLASANHPMRDEADCASTEQAALPVKPQADSAYCWDTGDATTQDWLPQSVTSSGDADDDGSWGTNKVILAGWAQNGATTTTEMARIAFIDANDPSAFKYRWVLLVVPLNGGTDYRALKSHMGGMVWYQDKLYVTAYNGDTDHNVLYVFDLGRILQATVNDSTVGYTGSGWSADNYQYVMPAIGSYSLSGGACTSGSDDYLPCFGSISLDRSSTPDSLVATEWFSSGGTQPARVWRYDFDTSTTDPGWLATDSSSQANAVQAFETSAVGLQGVLSYQPSGASAANWYVDDARGGVGQHGILWRQNTGGAQAAANCGTDITYACWGQHTEGMSYWWSTGRIWTLTEWAADAEGHWAQPEIPQRVLFSAPLSSIDSSLSG